MNLIKLKAAFKDHRGEITDLIDNDTINAITLITFTKGAVRANHYHKHTFQWNYVISGKVLLKSQMPGQEPVEIEMNPGDFAMTKPDEMHALKGLTDSQVLVFTKGPRAGSEYENDTFRLEKPLLS
jgi:quercetin dioxygenase-like cupin family protein